MSSGILHRVHRQKNLPTINENFLPSFSGLKKFVQSKKRGQQTSLKRRGNSTVLYGLLHCLCLFRISRACTLPPKLHLKKGTKQITALPVSSPPSEIRTFLLRASVIQLGMLQMVEVRLPHCFPLPLIL